MAYAGEETTLLRQRTGIRHHAEGVHLQAVVVVEAEGLVLNHARIQFESACLQALARAGMAGIQNRHIVLLGHLVDCIKEAQEVLLGVDILLAVGGK